MNILATLERFKRLSKKNIPRVIASRLRREFLYRLELILYPPSGPRLKRSSPPLRLIGLIHKDVFGRSFAEEFQNKFPDDARTILQYADDACAGVVDCLGSGPVDLRAFLKRTDLRVIDSNGTVSALKEPPGGRWPWHFDFKSGAGWEPETFFSKVRYGHVPGVDVKVPWELSRFQHAITLGQAYVLTKNEKYAKAFFDQFEDWVEHNPPKRGVNWACPMDVGLRAANWLAAIEFFKDSPSKTAFFSENFTRVLWEHGHHMARHLEWGGDFSSNHYLSDLLGLGYIGLAVGQPAWVRLATREMTSEIVKQTYNDGFDFEGSTAYHRLVLEIFFFFDLVLKPSSAEWSARLEKMFSFLRRITTNEGEMPFIGDNDSGRVHVFLPRPDKDVRYLNAWGSRGASWGGRVSEPMWLFGMDPGQKHAGPPAICRAGTTEANLIVLRGDDDYLLFNAAPNGTRGLGNHTHNDKLSFCLNVKGDWFFIDPGTYVYTPDPHQRNVFRSTRVHNTVEIDGQEQNRFDERNLFILKDDAKVRLLAHEANSTAAALHDGYARLEEPVTHERRVTRFGEASRWTVEDLFTGVGEHEFYWNFTLGEAIEVETSVTGPVILKGRSGSLQISEADNRLEFAVVTVNMAPGYGIRRPTRALRATVAGGVPFKIVFSLAWTPGGLD